MIAPMTLFLTVIAIFLVAGVGLALWFYRKRRPAEVSWERLNARLIRLDPSAIQDIALDMIDPSGVRRSDEEAFQMDPEEIWTVIGGLKGLAALETNSEVLIDMAAYLQQSYPQALVIAEELRLNAREIQWNVQRLKDAARTGKRAATLGQNAQNAVATYYLMTRQLLFLYEAVSSPHFNVLERAL
jgi:hypothetical protein